MANPRGATIPHSFQGVTDAGNKQHMSLNVVNDDKQVRLNSREFVQASGNSIGFQSKPNQTVTTTGEVIGGEISPRVQSAIGFGTLKGLHVDIDIKGTTGGNGTDIRVLELEAVDAGANTRTISGDVSFIRVRSNLSTGTISGHKVFAKLDNIEGSQAFDGLFKIVGNSALASKHGGAGAALPADAGFVRVIVADANGSNPVIYKLALFNN